MNEPLTKKLRNGLEVTAKLYCGEPFAITYANRTQAERAAGLLGSEWSVYHPGRPFYVAKTQPKESTTK